MRTTRSRNSTPILIAGCSILLGAALVIGCTESTSSPVPEPPRSAIAPQELFTNGTAPYVPSVAPTAAETKAAWNEGISLFDTGAYATAAAQLQIAASGRPDDARIHYRLGLALWKSGETQLAEQVLEHAASLDPSAPKTWINLARVRLDLDEAQTALEAADRAVAIDPSSPAALHQKGRALAILGRRSEALAALIAAHDADPLDGQIANTVGYWLVQSGRSEEAVPYLEIARDRLPGTAYVRNNLGLAYERTGRIEQARVEFRAAVEGGDSGGKAAVSLARLESKSVTAPAEGRATGGASGVPVAGVVPAAPERNPQK